MVINELVMYKFKKYDDIKMSFSKGLNIVKGPNESGKTTMRTALLTVLFYNPATTSEVVRKHRKWNENEMFRLELGYMDELDRYYLLKKDFHEKKMSLQCNGDYYKNPKAMQEKVLDDLGVLSEEMYLLTSSLDIRLLDNLGNETRRKQLGKKISTMMTGSESGQDIVTALRKIDESLKELGKGLKANAKNPGPIKMVQDNYQKLLALYAETKKNLESRITLIREKELLDNEIRVLTEENGISMQLIDTCKKYGDLIRRHKELSDQEQALAEKDENRKVLEKELNEINLRIGNEPLLMISSVQIEQILKKADERNQLDELIKNQKAIPEYQDNAWLMIAGVLIMVLGGISLFLHWALGVGFFILGTVIMLKADKKKKENKIRAQKESEKISQLLSEKEQIDDFIAKWENHLDSICDNKLREKWQNLQALKVKRDTIKTQIERAGEVDKEKWQETRRMLRLIADEISEFGMTAQNIKPEELIAKKRTMEANNIKLSDKNKRMAYLEAMINNENVNQETLSCIQEQILETERRMEYFKEKEEIMNLALHYMEKARQDTMNPAKQILETRTGELFSLFTNRKYQHVNIDAEDMTSKILIKDTDKWEDPAVLSQGTFDQFYLSMRLALSEILTDGNGKKTPLLLDEPLSAFDKSRFDASLLSLKKIAQERQILIFTCRDEYDYLADNIVALN